MSTKKETATSINYNPAGMNNYNSFQTPLNKGLTDFATNPLQASYFQNAYNMALSQNQMAGQSNIQSLMNNFKTTNSGGNMPGFQQALLNQSGRMTSMANANSFNTQLINGVNNQKWALNSMQSYTPLQTGQTTTEKTSGTGTWLPQVIGAGLGVAGAAMTGGLSTAAGWGKMFSSMAGTGANAFAGSGANNGGSSYWNRNPAPPPGYGQGAPSNPLIWS